jgi:predicted GTPase
VNFRRADLIIINKCDTAEEENIRSIEKNAAAHNPSARVIRANSPVTIDTPELVRGARVLVIEDGPTLTHGGMKYGAGVVAARAAGAAEIVDPRPFAVGSIVETYDKYPNATGILPAMGYGEQQIQELEETIRRTDADVVVVGTPIDLRRVLTFDKPAVRVRYELTELEPGVIESEIRKVVKAETPVTH